MIPTLEITWQENNQTHTAKWRAENGAAPPKRVVIGTDTLTADAAYRLACEGTAILWRSDFQNARQLLQAMGRRIDRKPPKTGATPTESFHLHRQAQAQRARILGMLLIEIDADYHIALRRAPDVKQACVEAYGAPLMCTSQPQITTLREILGLIGAHEWRKKGVNIPALGAHIHPHYGVFSPVRGEYLELLANAPLPTQALAFDIGTGTGVLAALLAKRGVKRVIATDQDPRALACAAENLSRLHYANSVELKQTDLFPAGCAPLIVCNPPWLPARPSSPIEYAVYDPESQMLRGFLAGLAEHLTPAGEGWLILSDIAEHLGLRSREQLLHWIAEGGLTVIARHDIQPNHPKVQDQQDVLHQARRAEVTSLWRLQRA